MNELSWINEACRHMGLREIKGAKHNPTIKNGMTIWVSTAKKAQHGGVMMRHHCVAI